MTAHPTNTTEPEDVILKWVTTRSMILGVLTIGGFAITGIPSMIFGAALGVVLGIGNFWVMRRLMWRIIHRPGRSRGMATGALLLKLAVLGALIFLVMSYLEIHPLALMGGLSVVVVTIMASGIFAPALPDEPAPEGEVEGITGHSTSTANLDQSGHDAA